MTLKTKLPIISPAEDGVMWERPRISTQDKRATENHTQARPENQAQEALLWGEGRGADVNGKSIGANWELKV